MTPTRKQTKQSAAVEYFIMTAAWHSVTHKAPVKMASSPAKVDVMQIRLSFPARMSSLAELYVLTLQMALGMGTYCHLLGAQPMG